MKILGVGIGLVLAMAMTAFASPASKAIVKGGEKAAAIAGLHVAEGAVARGGANLAAVTAERAAMKRTAGGVAAEAGKSVTAKNILAAGAATSMVVGAHEMADGVQQMGEGVKEAVVANPEIAQGIADSVMSPINWLTVLIGLAGLAFLAWFAWPWIVLARNWSRLAAARRAAAMRSSVPASRDAEAAMHVEASSPAGASSGYNRVELILVVLGFMLLTILGLRHMTHREDGKNTSTIRPKLEEHQDDDVVAGHNDDDLAAKRALAVDNLKKSYLSALEKCYADYQSEVKSVAKDRFDTVRAGIPGVVERYGTFSRCKDLLVMLAKDKFDDGNRMEEWIKHDLEADFYRGLYDARDNVYDCTVAFLRNAEAARLSFMRDLEVELDSVELPGDEDFKALLVDGGDRVETCKSNLLSGQVEMAVAVAVEAATVRTTVSTIAKMLGKGAGRMAGSAAFGAGAAAVDGPLPIGDVVGGVVMIGSTCWTAYDVWRVTEVLPEELAKILRMVADDCEIQALNEFRRAGCDIYMAYRNVIY